MSTPASVAAAGTTAAEFSPIDNELPLRWFRKLHLVPPDGIGAGRRAVFLALVTWLPIAVWAAIVGRLVSADVGEPLLQHYGVHVRCLLAIPLLVLAEAALHGAARPIAAQFVASGIVGPGQQAAFEQATRDVRRLRDSSLPWVLVLGVALAWSLANHPTLHEDPMAWALAADGKLGFGGWWFAYVVRPIFLALVFGWLWRILLVAYWFWRVGRIGLLLVPTHPDRAGGLAFLEKVPGAFAMVTFALSAVIASRWAHELAYHEASLQTFIQPGIAFICVWTLLALLPLLALAPTMAATRGRAIPAYSTLVGEQGRLVHRRWILREPVGDEPILNAPELGPVADASSLFDAVKRMRKFPIGKASLVMILGPIMLPMLAAAMLRIPAKELLLKVFKALV
jgi:hypothetical protein